MLTTFKQLNIFELSPTAFNTDPTNPNAGGNYRRSLIRAIEDSLQRLNTNYIDLYWLHAWDYRSPI